MTQVFEVLPNNPIFYLAGTSSSQHAYDPYLLTLINSMYPSGFSPSASSVLNSSIGTTEATRIQTALILYHHINTTSYVLSVGNTFSGTTPVQMNQIQGSSNGTISVSQTVTPQMACALGVKGGLQIPYSSNPNLYIGSFGLLFYGAFSTRIMLEQQPINTAFSSIYVEFAQETPMSQNPLACIGQINANYPAQTLTNGVITAVDAGVSQLTQPTGVVILTNFIASTDQVEDQTIKTLISNIQNHNYLSVANMISINPLLWIQNAEFLFLLYRFIKTKQLSVQNI